MIMAILSSNGYKWPVSFKRPLPEWIFEIEGTGPKPLLW
jgi:hypothetical protein